MPSTIIAYGVMEMGLSLAAATFMANMAVSFALSFVVTRIFGSTPPSQQDQGTRQQIPPNTANSIPMVYGDAYLGGTFIDACLTTDQKTMYYVLAISTISPDATFSFDQTKMYYGDRLITFGTGASVASLSDQAIPPNVDTTIAGNLEIYLYKSNATGTITPVNTSSAPSTVMGSGSGLDSAFQWTGTRQMNGLAFAIVKLKYSREAQTTSLQPITFKVSQYATGLDRARPGDVWYDYMTNPYYGGAIDPAYIDTDSRDALNTYADQLITYTPSGGGSATQRRYKINGVINAGETVLNNVDKILAACDSWMAYNAPTGKWSIVINKAESTSYAFDDDNIIGDIRVSATDITSSINQVEAKFPNKDNKDQPAYVNIETPSGLLYPNEPTNKYSITYDLVNDNVQAQYLANRLLEQAREDLIVSFNTTYYGIQVDAGNVVSVTNSSYGWTNKLFRVMKVNEVALADGTLGAKLDLNEYNAQVYDDQDITAFTPAANSGLPSPVYFSALAAPTVTGYPTASSPTFSVSCYIPITGRVTFCSLFYTTVASPAASDWHQLDYASTVNSQPVINSTSGTPQYYVFANEKLAAGTYYFAYVVGNETSQSAVSSLSSAFVWTPIAPTGPTGAAGPTGPTGSGTTGATGPRSASGYIYYNSASASAPATPSASGFNFSTGTFSSLTSGWSTTFTAPNPITNPATEAGSNFWAVRYNVSEITYGGSQSVTLTSPFNWQNLNGLVTFTNVATNSGTTFIDGGNIVTGTIVANKLTSGTASITGGYTFLLASNGETINGFPAAVGGSNSNSSGMGVSGWITSTSGDGWGATTGATRAVNGIGIAGYNSVNSTFNSFRTFGAFGQGAWGFSSIYHRSWGTVGNQSLPPVTYAIGGSGDNGLYAAYWGNTSTARINEVFLGNASTTNAVVARRWIPDGGAIRTEANLATYDYCLYSTAGASYVAAGYLPFTGVHDGLVEDQDVYEVGDIVVDDQVLDKIDISNVVVSYKRSSVAMEKGVIGVFVQSYDAPPADWNHNVAMPIASGSSGSTENLNVPVAGDPAIPNPVAYPVPAGMKVAHMNALGEGLVNVCGEGGDIAKGDFLTTSSMAGKGMKQADDVFHSYTFGKSREDVTFSSPTEVKQIACIYMAG